MIRKIIVDTHHFKGNHPEACSVEVAHLSSDPEAEDIARLDELAELVPRSPLSPDAENAFSISHDQHVTHLRLNIYPDGGVARLRVLGEVQPDWKSLRVGGDLLDLIAVEHGGVPLSSSDQFFGEAERSASPSKS